MTNLIGVSGKIGAGKDTVGKIIQYLTAKETKIYNDNKPLVNLKFEDYNAPSMTNWRIKKLAYKLKQIVSILTGIKVENLEEEEVKNQLLGEEWNRNLKDDKRGEVFGTPNIRWLLQHIGNEAMRDVIHPNIWCIALFTDYDDIIGYMTKDHAPNWIITDVRYPNEAKAIKDRGGILIRVNRGFSSGGSVSITELNKKGEYTRITVTKPHKSETALDTWKYWDYVIDNSGTIEKLIEKVKQILIKEKII